MWKDPLGKRFDLKLPVVEQTPILWNDEIVLIETWDEAWETQPWNESVPRSKRQYFRARKESDGEIISKFMRGYGYSSAFKWEDKIYVFGSTMTDVPRRVSENVINMSYSGNLVDWSEPQIILSEPQPERIFNTSVCYDGEKFVLSYETDCDVFFTLKFAESKDLKTWNRIPDTFLGRERYTACPAIRFSNGYYYVMYLDWDRVKWWFETRIARSRDLINWEKSPHPVLVPNQEKNVHPDCPEHAKECNCDANGKECNTSDPDLIEWHGKTRLYFTGGCQHHGGLLQYTEFDGTMDKFFEAYFTE